MKNKVKGTILGLFALSLASTAFADGGERGTAEDAQSIVKAAVAMSKKEGKEKTFAEGNNPQTTTFRRKEVYLFAYHAPDAVSLVHANPKLLGKALMDLRDAKGFYINKRIMEICGKEKTGWVEYDWPNAATNKVEPKRSYVECVDDVAYVAGYYK